MKSSILRTISLLFLLFFISSCFEESGEFGFAVTQDDGKTDLELDLEKVNEYKMMKENNVEPTIFKKGPKKPTGPKKTQFKLLLEGTEEEQKQANIFPSEFVIDDFIVDCKKGMKIVKLMSKYNVTLYQIRELRKQYELTKR